MVANGLITFTTDFGLTDGFVGTTKGVVRKINPAAQVIDISHQIPPQDIDAAAFVIRTSYRYFPAGTLHMVVVDPGVGSQRKIIAVETEQYFFLAPDNSVLKYIFHDEKIIRVINVANKQYFLQEISQTFHGRDIFSPVAAHIAAGVELKLLGDEIHDFERGKVLTPVIQPHKIIGHVIYIDRFGNLITNISNQLLKKVENIIINVGTIDIQNLSNSYADVRPGEAVALLGSSGFLEIGIRNGNAQRTLNVNRNGIVELRF